jgi:tetratricopeptide (TPR) repeat protein
MGAMACTFDSELARGKALYEEERFDEARACLQAAIALGEKSWGTDSPRIVDALNWLARATAEKKYGVGNAEVLAIYDRALRIVETRDCPDDLATAVALSNVALELWSLHRHEEALPIYRRVLAIREAELQEDDYRVSGALEDLGSTLVDMNRFDEAIPLLERRVRVADAHPHETARLVAHMMLGRAYLGAKRDAVATFEVALSLAERQGHAATIENCRNWLDKARAARVTSARPIRHGR